RHPRGTAADNEHGFTHSGVHGIDSDQMIPFRFTFRIDGPNHQQLVAHQSRILARRDDGADNLSEKHERGSASHYAFALDALPIGGASSRCAGGRGITWTETSSRTRRAAAAPASVGALTAATSPRTIAVT